MNKIAMELLVEVAEQCKDRVGSDSSIMKRELFSRAFAEIADILEKELSDDEED